MALTKESLMDFLVDNLGVERSELDENTALFSSGLQDSFSIVELLIHIETEENITLNPSDVSLDNLDSVTNILNFLGSQQSSGL